MQVRLKNGNAPNKYALKGRAVTAQGAALGKWSVQVSQALKGRYTLTDSLSRSFRATLLCVAFLPRAAPWAFIFGPFRAISLGWIGPSRTISLGWKRL
jgi:hypothetical protein